MTQQEALSILQTGANVFLTGEPGSGKTHTVSAYVSWLRARGIEPAITASTGIAATHLHGQTIHSWSGIGIETLCTPEVVDRIASKEHVVRRIQKAAVLIIDEVSMLSGETLTLAEAVCREARRNDRPFGGLQVVMVGDFFQLPPISRQGAAASFAFESPVWRAVNPVVCYLTEQHRQDDPAFLSVLTSIRTAEVGPGDVSRILTRETDADALSDDTPRLHTHNADVDRVNAEKLSALSGTARTFSMAKTGGEVLVSGLVRGCLSPETLVLKEGAAVMCTKNNPAAGYANGTVGVVTQFERGTGYPIIETRDGREIIIAPADWALEQEGKVRAKISQVPLRLAWAITVHKSQGMSMDEAAIDLSRTFEYGQGYVALSRVRRLSGLYLLGWSDAALRIHPSVAALDRELREASVEAAAAFAALEEQGDREEMERNFLRTIGGSPTPSTGPRPAKKSTYDETLGHIEAGTSLADIAKERELTLGTIADHAEKLLSGGRLEKGALLPLVPQNVQASLPKIREAFKKSKDGKLAPVHAALGGRVSYDDLKIARLLL